MGPHQITRRIVRFNDEKMWAIFSDNQNNICYRTLKENMGWETLPYICKRENEFGVLYRRKWRFTLYMFIPGRQDNLYAF